MARRRAQSEPMRTKVFRVSTEMADRIDTFRFGGKYRTEGEALRDIIAAGLDAMNMADKHGERDAELKAA